jgi:hypothetical protein
MSINRLWEPFIFFRICFMGWGLGVGVGGGGGGEDPVTAGILIKGDGKMNTFTLF